ncbi:thiamine phosphate synthase [Halomonas sp. TBZ9]|uniref:Thiamine-phosphate synthase n=1 Tax=Vreelandella azerica TaxID=2732867 RepID=A0A7Y3TWK2_9GAMM|nr:thiamine phosphate synthase [Halomonas azerica]NOG31248.1 thiamine phosphate synthase [Halomonas azerica]
MPLDLSLYLVTDAGLCAEKTLERTVEDAVAGGVSIVQLRDKQASNAAMTEQAKRLKSLLAGTGVPLIINDRLEVAIASQADGLHVGQSDATIEQARQALGEKAIIGLSVNTLMQLSQAPISLLDYFGFGPVFATPSKGDHEPPIGFEGLAALTSASRLPGVAIGGLKAAHMRDAKRSGAAGVAVISAICGQASPRESAYHLARQWADA